MVDWKKIRDEYELDLTHCGKHSVRLMESCERNLPSLISALEEQEKRIEFLEQALWQAIREGSFEISDDRVLGPNAWVQFCVYKGIEDHETIEVRPAEYMKELSQVLADEKESLREKNG